MKRTLFDTYAADYHRLHASNVAPRLPSFPPPSRDRPPGSRS